MKKPQPTLCVSVNLRLHSDMHIWAPSFWTLRILSILLWGPSGTLVKEKGSPILVLSIR